MVSGEGKAGRLLTILLIMYLAVSLITLWVWAARGVYEITGDEPHYLIIADSLVNYGTLDLTAAYTHEFLTNSIFASGLAPAGAPITAPEAHVVAGSHGLFSWHGLGISVLTAIPFAMAGVLGAKLIMVALGLIAVIVSWRIAGVLFTKQSLRFVSVLGVVIGYPLIPASNQIYPDLVAGILILSSIYFLMSADIKRNNWSLVGYGFIIGFLPWLGTKYIITTLILMVALTFIIWRSRHSLQRVAAFLLPILVSGATLMAFNIYAFGQLIGPPSEGALEVSATALMVMWGLLFDQNQGALFQNPLLWVALFGLATFFTKYRFVALTWILVTLSIWLPGAMHPGWYGLGSFVGRYSWALAILLIVPALVGLSKISRSSLRTFWIVIGLGISVNALMWSWTTFFGGASPGRQLGVDLYTKSPSTWLESYSIWYFPFQDWMPALYNIDWAATFWPNYVWILLGVVVAAIGTDIQRQFTYGAAAVTALAIIGAGVVATPGPRIESQTFNVSIDEAEYLPISFAWLMRQGPYAWNIRYAADAKAGSTAGKWELVQVSNNSVVAAGELKGTDGFTVELPTQVPYFSLHPQEFILRIASYGTGKLTVDSLGIRHG